MAFTGTLIKNAGTVEYNSLFPYGDANAPSTGVSITGTVAHGNLVTLIAGEDINFGDVGPDFLVLYKLENMTAGTDLTLVEGTTHKTGFIATSQKLYYTAGGTYKVPIRTVAGLPYSTGMAVGDHQAHNRDSASIFAKMRIDVTRESAKIFRSAYLIWPAANQVNQLADHAGGEQVKLFGDQNDDGFSTGLGVKVDVYTGLYSTTGDGSTMESKGVMAKSNSSGFHDGDSWLWPASGNGFLGHQVTVDSTHQKSNVQIYQSFFISRNPTNTAHSRVIDTDLGEMCNYTDTDVTPAQCEFTNFNNFEFPKNCQGMNIPQDKNFFVGQVYQSYGEGAACRIEVADVETPQFQETGVLDPDQKKLSCCVPVLWSNKVLQIEIVEGLFAGGSLSGKWMHIYGIDNNFITSVVIP